ncbi:4'-phosphopantetheine phosphatase [Coccomyxa sp. Obi]|nr:4'-phosphopantetheine phosphatase [Coccomyxa sp. Obi]
MLAHADRAIALQPLPQIVLSEYQAGTFDYVSGSGDGPEGRNLPTLRDWIEVFRASIPQFRHRAATDISIPEAERKERATKFAQTYEAILKQLEENGEADVPGFRHVTPSCISLCALREECLRKQGYEDVFATVKAEENEKALALLPGVLRDLDAITDHSQRLEMVLRGVFAGNIFDLGAASSADLFSTNGAAFESTRANILPRPWAVDDMDAVLQVWERKHYSKALLFVDNAGSDVVLGMLPLARELLQRGTAVVLAANSRPAINDITADELRGVVARAAAEDKILGRAVDEGALKVVPSGNDQPVIDLRKVSPEVISEAGDADLVVLEGMGRGIETNLHAQLTVDSLKLGMIKHKEVAQMLNGRLYDCVCKYTEGRP